MMQPIRTDLPTAELDYELPDRLIATQPVEPRDSAKLLVMSRSSESIEHAQVRDLPRFLRAGDALVFNTTAVVPARLVGTRIGTDGKVEGLFLHALVPANDRARWEVMLHAGGRLKIGDRIALSGPEEHAESVVIELLDRNAERWTVAVEGSTAGGDVLDSIGRTPLPPYILKARGDQVIADEKDRHWYQTVYADALNRGSVAAPTAGLHFTSALLERLHAADIQRIDVTLHVGVGTFKPITAGTLAEHRMHSEEFEVSAAAVADLSRLRLQRHRDSAGRIVALGTTSVRTLESLAWNGVESAEPAVGYRGATDLLIAPPYQFKCVDGMLTNFHLPRSTLLALVGAMVGLERLKEVYRVAIGKGYRFYSYGDAMLVLP